MVRSRKYELTLPRSLIEKHKEKLKETVVDKKVDERSGYFR